MLDWLTDKFQELTHQVDAEQRRSAPGISKNLLPEAIRLDLNKMIGGRFDTLLFLKKVKRRFAVIHRARYNATHLNEARNFLSDGLFNQLRRQQQINTYFNIEHAHTPLTIKSIRIVGYERDPFYDTLHVGIAAVNQGSSSFMLQEIFSFCRKPGVDHEQEDDNLCPNCGYRLELSSDIVKCPSCKVLINSGHYSWVLREISHAPTWRAPSKRMIPGLTNLQHCDSTFCIQNSEDKMRSYFWQLQESLLTGEESAIGTLGSGQFCNDFLRFRESGVYAKQHKLFCDIKIETVELVYAETVKDYIELTFIVSWHAIQAIRHRYNRISCDNKRSSKRQGFTMRRKIDSIPKMNCGLSSLSCINCGGPLSYSKNGICQYCHSQLNNPSVDWVLIAMPNYYDINQNLKYKRQEMRSIRGITATLPLHLLNDKFGLLAGLVGMAAIDGVISVEEYKLLTDYAAKTGIAKERLDGIIDDANNNCLEVPIPRSNEEARTWMKALIDLTLADAMISTYEEDFLAEFGHHFNFSKFDTDTMIKEERSERHTNQ